MSRILTLIKIRERDAIKITLDIKKELVEHLRIEITQQELEKILFRKIEEFQYGERFINRYKLVTKFY